MQLEDLRLCITDKMKPGYLFQPGERIGSKGKVIRKYSNNSLEVGSYVKFLKIIEMSDTSVIPIKALYVCKQ